MLFEVIYFWVCDSVPPCSGRVLWRLWAGCAITAGSPTFRDLAEVHLGRERL